MSNSKQSSIEWFDKEINKLNFLLETRQITNSEFNQLKLKTLNKANAMHKEEIVNAVDGFPIHARHLNGEEYYNETFNNHETK